MLVLTRKSQEIIQIGPNITVTIVRVKGRSVRVGIDAPRNVRVVRGELAIDAAEASADEEPTIEDTPTEQPRPMAVASPAVTSGLHNRVSRLVGQLRQGEGRSAEARQNPKPPASNVSHTRLVRQPSRLAPATLRTLIRR